MDSIINFLFDMIQSPWSWAAWSGLILFGYTWTTKVNAVDTIDAAHVNLLQTEKLDRDGDIPLTGVSQWLKGADIASAATLTLTHASNAGNYFDVTGTTGITKIAQTDVGGSAVQAGSVLKLHFDSALTITHDNDYIVLPDGANINVEAGDELEFVCYSAGKWRLTGWIGLNHYYDLKDCVEMEEEIRYPATLTVAEGGTGVVTLTQYGVLVGEGTGAIQATAAGAAGEIFIGKGSAKPGFLGAGALGTVLIGKGAADPEMSANPPVTTVILGGAAMKAESSGTVGTVNYATDAGREAVGGRALEVIVKSQNSATYHRMILDNRQDCVLLTELIAYA